MLNNADFLAQTDLFLNLPPDLRPLVSQLFQERSFADDEIVFRIGGPSDHIFVVKAGAIVLFTYTIGEPVTLKARVEPGGLFGEVGVLQRTGRTLSARASGATVLLELDGHSLLELAGAYDELALRLSKIALRYSFMNRSSAAELGRRREARIRIAAAVDLRIGGEGSIPVTLDNLSLGGVCLAGLPEGWDLSEGALMSFVADQDEALLSVYGRVVWRKSRRLGVAFTETLPDHETMVSAALQHLIGAFLPGSA